MPDSMPSDYTTAEADAHEAGWHGAVSAAIAAVSALPVGALHALDGPYARGAYNSRINTLEEAALAIAGLTPPARPAPTRLGILGEG